MLMNLNINLNIIFIEFYLYVFHLLMIHFIEIMLKMNYHFFLKRIHVEFLLSR